MTQPGTAGEALESAVHAIESAVLARNPAAAKARFTIERRKLIEVEGVKHEIDVYVVVDMGAGYQAIVIFECKDRKKAVGKNDIIVFSEKIRASGAQSGYFVAPAFGRHAKAQAQQDRRIHLLSVTKDLGTLPPIVSSDVVVKDIQRVRTEVRYVVRHRSDPMALSWLPVTGTIDGIKYAKFGDYLRPIVTEMVEACLARTPTHQMSTGEHQLETAERHEVVNGTVNGIDIIGIKLKAFFPILVIRPLIVSSYDVATRGRVIKTDVARLPNNDQISFEYVFYEPAV